MRPTEKLVLTALAFAAARSAMPRKRPLPLAVERHQPGHDRAGTRTLPVPEFEIDGIPVCVEGQGSDAILMLHGWPDTLRLWDAQVAMLSQHYRCVRFTLPGFDAERRSQPMPVVQMVAFIDRVANAVSPTRPLVLLLHDWGCAYGYQYALTHPSRVSWLIGVDVGDAGSGGHRRSLTLADKAMIAAYQWWLAAAWRIGGPRGDTMTRRLARLTCAPGSAASIGHAMDYPYYLLWSGAYADPQERMQRFEPPCPMLYIFGRRKPVQFHSPSWAANLAARPGSQVVGMDTGHWPMHEKPAEFNEAVLSWLASRSASVL